MARLSTYTSDTVDKSDKLIGTSSGGETKNFVISDVVEKPSVRSAPSNYAVIGRYILPKKIFNVLKDQKPGKNKEIHITDAIRNLIIKKNKFYGHIFAGKYLDCGSMKGYIESSLKISKL